ncbi:MAG: class I SAM-dependent methyltransferase [Polyangiaceae bacterium]
MNASAETDTVYIPPSTEHVSCVVCGADEPIPVGAKARFNMDVSSVTCARCGLVYITPRPTIEDMARYYATSYRIHYGSVGAIRADGTRITPDSPDWEAYTDGRYQHQAELVAPLLQPGAKVLEMGCRYGRTLSLLADKHGAIPYGIEPGEADAEKARKAGVNCFTGTVENFDPGETRFDLIQSFHVLEHVHDPLAVLMRLRGWLAPGGKLLVEVPNVHQPYGLLEGNFFQNVHLFNFGPHTLSVLFKRAGLGNLRVIDESTLYVLGEPTGAQQDVLPLPYTGELHPNPAQSGEWMARHLRAYSDLEIARQLILAGDMRVEILQATAHLLRGPSFTPHMAAVIGDLVEHFNRLGSPKIALILVRAALAGPHPTEIKQGLSRLEGQLAAADVEQQLAAAP